MKTRALFAAPIFVALALHAWASGAYPQDVFVALLALAAIPLGGRVPLGQTAQRVFALLSFVGGAVIGWSRVPDLGYGPGTLSRSASLIAVGSLLSAVSRLYARAGWSGERATFVLATLAVAASGATRLGLGYAAFAAAYVVLALLALRARDPGRARAPSASPFVTASRSSSPSRSQGRSRSASSRRSPPSTTRCSARSSRSSSSTTWSASAPARRSARCAT